MFGLVRRDDERGRREKWTEETSYSFDDDKTLCSMRALDYLDVESILST
jgi:hypothetical protein